MNIRDETKTALTDANEIARAQLLRFRSRLGTLSHDQELQIEDLLISTVAKISLMTRGVMEALADNSPTKLKWLKTTRNKQDQVIDKSEM